MGERRLLLTVYLVCAALRLHLVTAERGAELINRRISAVRAQVQLGGAARRTRAGEVVNARLVTSDSVAGTGQPAGHSHVLADVACVYVPRLDLTAEDLTQLPGSVIVWAPSCAEWPMGKPAGLAAGDLGSRCGAAQPAPLATGATGDPAGSVTKRGRVLPGGAPDVEGCHCRRNRCDPWVLLQISMTLGGASNADAGRVDSGQHGAMQTAAENEMAPLGETPTSALLENGVTSAQRELATAQANVTALEKARTEVLLSGSDTEAEAHDAQLAAARRQVDRLQAVIPRLEARLEEARDATRQDQVAQRIQDAEALQASGVALVAEYGKHAHRIAEILRELQAIDVAIDQVRTEAQAAGRGDEVPESADATARPRADYPLYGTQVSERFEGGQRQGGVFLPSATGEGPMIYGPGPVITRSRAEEAKAKADEFNRRRAEEEAARRDPKPTRPAGTYDIHGNPASPHTRHHYALYERELAAWQQRNPGQA